MNDIAGIGHNQASPFDLSFEEIDGLFVEARNWLDGKGVNSEADATGVSKLLDAARQARSTADDARKAEKKPHDDAGKAVQERWKPVLEKADLVATTCKAALKPYLEKLDLEKQAVAEKARREAKDKMEAAAAALRASEVTDIAARDHAERLLKDAKRAETAATRAEKDKAQANGGARAVGLRSTWRPVLTDGRIAAKHYWGTRRPEMESFLVALATSDVHAGKREIPGFNVVEEKSAV